ncbi:MAG TPA: hypothetical protein VGL99_24335 [Chloroflexota bacterium]|jgi:hypothetical protein
MQAIDLIVDSGASSAAVWYLQQGEAIFVWSEPRFVLPSPLPLIDRELLVGSNIEASR